MSVPGEEQEGQQGWNKVSERGKGRRGAQLEGRLADYVEFWNPLSEL